MATAASLPLKSLASPASAASHSRIASWMLARASSRVLPCEWQPRNAGRLTEMPSSCSINVTLYFMPQWWSCAQSESSKGKHDVANRPASHAHPSSHNLILRLWHVHPRSAENKRALQKANSYEPHPSRTNSSED